MKFRVLLLLIVCLLLVALATGQTEPPAANPPAQQNPPANPQPPVDDKTKAPTESKPQSPPPAQATSPAEGTASQPGVPVLETPPGAEEANDPAATIIKTVNEVPVIFTVTDKHGRYIKGLKKDDFKVIDDRKVVDHIQSFRSETDLPLQVGLLVDASNSVRDRFKFEQESAIEFLNATIRPRYDVAFVVGFDATPDVTQDFTDSTEALSKGVRSLRPGGGTAMFDALYYSCRDKLLKREQTGPVRRAIILLSDGDDNLSHVTREEAIDMAQRAEVIIYTISTNISGMKGKGDKILERIADATGGRAFFPFQIRDVADAFMSIQEELRSQYAMSYKPADFIADGRYRTIEIQAVREKSFRVRTRKGYYAPKP